MLYILKILKICMFLFLIKKKKMKNTIQSKLKDLELVFQVFFKISLKFKRFNYVV